MELPILAAKTTMILFSCTCWS